MPHLRADKVTRLKPSETYKLLLNQKTRHPKMQNPKREGPVSTNGDEDKSVTKRRGNIFHLTSFSFPNNFHI